MRWNVPTIERTLSEKLKEKDGFLVAFSGGADSLALLVALKRIGKECVALYVNHHIRPEEELAREVSLNGKNCRSLSIPFIIRDIDGEELKEREKDEGTEQAARNLRYDLLLSEAKVRHLILLTAHNGNDQMETVLMHLFQGGDPLALAISGESVREGVTLLRPLLSFSHSELLSYVRENGFTWSEDSTNGDEAYLRNRIRRQIVPVVMSVFPGAVEAVGRYASRSASLVSFVKEESAKVPLGQSLSRVFFLSVPPYLRDEVLYRFLSRGRKVPYAFLFSVREKMEGKENAWRLEQGTVSVSFHDGKAFCDELRECSFCVPLGKGEETILPDGNSFLAMEDSPLMDSSFLRIGEGVLSAPILRSPLQGDAIALQDGTVKLSKLFKDWKIPPACRSHIPVLEDRRGVVAVFAKAYGGRDRLALSYKLLAPRHVIVYYVLIRKKA